MIVRALAIEDLAAANQLQHLCYPAPLRDSIPALRSRLDIAGHHCVAAFDGPVMRGYILAHPWPGRSPPAPDTVLSPPTDDGLVHYIHDLSVDPACRGSGVGRDLVATSQAAARAVGLVRSELIAIAGAGGYWRRQGYVEVIADERLAAKLRLYGAGAAYLHRSL